MGRTNVLGEAAQKLHKLAEVLWQSGCTEEAGLLENTSTSMLYNAAKRAAERYERGAGLLWRLIPVTTDAVYLKGERYSSWHAAGAAAALGEGWRLPTPEELKALYAEQPQSLVFAPKGYVEHISNGRYGELKAQGVGHITALWTAQDDSRDFAIEATVTEEFGLSFHPALKSRLITVWLVKPL